MKKEKIVGNIDHLVMVVRSIEKAKPFFSELLDMQFMDVEVSEEWGFRSVMSPSGVELLEPTHPDSDAAKFIDKRGEGLYALAFTVSDIDKASAKVEKMGIRVVGSITFEKGPLKGTKEIWLHPKDNFGVYAMFAQGNPFHT
ncbi:VOC family protein [Chloroflexota bacterium]